jgi:SAM-dependent methyltransferase
MNIKTKAESMVQKMANRLGYEIHRLPKFTYPPSEISNLVGPGTSIQHEEIGKKFMKYFKDIGGLKPYEDVLDVGCGYGRMAVQLTKYLNRRARYEGFDIVPVLIEWCKTNISARYPNFNFQLIDLYNGMYVPNAQRKASDYIFPYKDESFDFVFLTSVFTHMMPQDVENYLSEIRRVLRKGKRCLITYFLLNEQSLALSEAKLCVDLDFKYVFDNYRTVTDTAPENVVAYDEQYIRKLYDKYGLRIQNSIHYGSWCGRKEYLSYQDIIVAEKV